MDKLIALVVDLSPTKLLIVLLVIAVLALGRLCLHLIHQNQKNERMLMRALLKLPPEKFDPEETTFFRRQNGD